MWVFWCLTSLVILADIDIMADYKINARGQKRPRFYHKPYLRSQTSSSSTSSQNLNEQLVNQSTSSSAGKTSRICQNQNDELGNQQLNDTEPQTSSSSTSSQSQNEQLVSQSTPSSAGKTSTICQNQNDELGSQQLNDTEPQTSSSSTSSQSQNDEQLVSQPTTYSTGNTSSICHNQNVELVSGLLDDTEVPKTSAAGNDGNENDEPLVNRLLRDLQEDNGLNVDDDLCDGVDDYDLEEDDSESHHGDSPIYPGHTMSLQTSVLLIWIYIVHCSLTMDQISGLLSLLNLHFMVAHPALRSVYSFKRVFNEMQRPYVKHHYCNFCMASVNDAALVCSNQFCGKDMTVKGAKAYFLEFPVESQLVNLFQQPEFRENLQHRNVRKKKSPHHIEDIYDGNVYKNMLFRSDPMHADQNNVSFTMNTDGVPVFKSSQTSVWPIFLSINELPFGMRKQQENMLLCGLWFGKSKPNVRYFQPLHESLKTLERGIDIPVKDNIIKVKGFLICLSCDIPARSLVLNTNQHNGEYSCIKCVQPGDNYRTEKGGNIRVFPYQEHPNPEAPTQDKIAHATGPARGGQSSVADSYQATQSGTTVRGIKGPSFLMQCPGFDYIRSVSVDYMHLVFLGVVRLLTKLMFQPTFSAEPFSVYKFVDLIDERLTSIKPSHLVSRVPRSISDSLKFWKAAELRNWFFYYSIPCLMDLLQPHYLYHYAALIEGIYLLSQDSISETDINRSEYLLNYFVYMMGPLYGERYMTINVHSLLHLPQTVRDLGPLWATSCFMFESANGELLKMFHGTQYIDIQMINACSKCLPVVTYVHSEYP